MATDPLDSPIDYPPSGNGAVQAPSAASEPSLPRESVPLPKFWGPWATIGWTVLCLVVMIASQIAVVIAFAVASFARNGKVGVEVSPSSGLLLSVATLTSTPIVVGLVAILIAVRRCSIREYLALTVPPPRQAYAAACGLALLLAASDLTSYLLGHPVVPQFMIEIYRSGWLPLLLITLVLAAPLGEEVLFRGFLYRGIAASRWGPRAAIILSSIAWATVHIQYDLYEMATIFVMGLYLGVVRHWTASLPLTMLLHGIANAVATAEVMIRVRGLD